MSNRKKCSGITRSGESCKNNCQDNSDHCRHHHNSSKITQFNEECPVCLSNIGEMHLMSCMHRIHLDCASRLISLECPLCRSGVNNFPESIREKIITEKQKYQNELEEEDRRNLETREREIREIIGENSLYVSPPVQIEAVSAMQFLRNQGIPLSYLPTNIQISLPGDSPRPPPGTLFYAILGHVMEKIDQDLRSGEIFGTPLSEPYEPEDDSSDEENPFEWENENLSILSRSVQVRNT